MEENLVELKCSWHGDVRFHGRLLALADSHELPEPLQFGTYEYSVYKKDDGDLVGVIRTLVDDVIETYTATDAGQTHDDLREFFLGGQSSDELYDLLDVRIISAQQKEHLQAHLTDEAKHASCERI